MKYRGFSLIELLVVIAIIGLLATFAVVQVGSSREKARVAKAGAHSAQILRAIGDDVLIRWDFNECSGTTASDSSGSGNTLTLAGSAAFSTESPTNLGCSFTGLTATTLISPASVTLNWRSMTASAWFRTTNWGDQNILSNGLNQILSTYTGLIRACPTGAGCLAGTTRVDDNKWHLVTFVGDTTSMRMYLDGNARPEATLAGGGTNLSGQQLRIGTFTGFLDDVRFYGRPLTVAEIQQLYAEGTRQYLALP